MNVTSLLTRLSNFAPPSVPAPAEDKGRPASDNNEPPVDRFGPALRVGLSEQAQKLLDQFQSGQAGQAGQAEDSAKVRIHRSVAYAPSHQPTPQQMAAVYEIAAKYAHDIRPDAAQRMMEELRQQGLHPDQLAREIDAEAVAGASGHDAPATDGDGPAPRQAAGTAVGPAQSIVRGVVANGFTLQPSAETALVA